ncbi:SurA N-terminal domain-containing protein [Pyruvatibacter sp.]|uniref:SurA N-terminal domain-containing protein n=1 Tax=Pyruvatibacter sp. TaxID=1981328 RepID=UPI0032EBE776
MLNKLRKNASGFVAQIFIGLLVLSFAVWGINDIFTPTIDTTVAEVGGEEIDGNLFLFEYQRDLNQRSQAFGRQLTRNEGQTLGFDRQVLDQMIGRTALDVAARDLGLVAGEELVIDDIRTDPAFQGPTGQFDRETFQQTLFTNGVSEEFLIDDRKRFIARQQLVEAVSQGIEVPDGFARQMYSVINETRKARYVVLTPEMVDAPDEPTEEELTSFYEVRGQGLFREPEYRTFSYVLMTPENVAQSIEISEEALRDEYTARKAEFDVPERRAIEQINYPTLEEAQAARASLNEGKTFAALADDQGLAPEDFRLGTLTRNQLFSEDIADPAFALEEGQVSDPVEGPLGYVLIRAAQVIPAVESTFEDVRDRLRTELARDRAFDELFDLANQVEDARAGGAPLADSASVLGLVPTSVPAVTQAGLGRDGRRPDALPTDPVVLATAYDTRPGDEAPMGELDDGSFFWVEVSNISEARTPPLEEVREQVIETWKTEEREASLLRLAADLSARINAGETIEKIAAEFGRAPIETPELRRGMSNETFSRIAINNLFSINEGEATYGPVGFGNSVVIMQATDVISGDALAEGDEFSSFQEQLAGAVADDLMVQYVNAVRNDLGVTVNPQAVNYVIGGEDQRGGAGM